MQPPPFRSLSDRCQPAGFTTHLHIESKSSDSVQVVDRERGLKAAHVSQKLILSQSDGQECTSILRRYHIILMDTAGMLDKATVPSDMSLSLHFGCGFSP